LLGVGILLLGFWPRLVSGILYGYIGWSFLMEMIGTLLDFNRVLLVTSILHHMALLPAAEPRWSTTGLMLGAGMALAVIGIARLNRRDIEAE
jgi:putative exporter of polyketide antibiotics